MIAGLDSSADAPTVAAAVAARDAGVRVWGGYLAVLPGVGLLAPWQRWQFDVARLTGGPPLAFCSGWDDPARLRPLADAWGVRLCLDVESGIRGDGPWVGSFLEASGAGLYGLGAVHHWPAPFHIVARYPGQDPRTTWDGPRPPGPCGWQWQGTHSEFGLSVDRLWLDDWFGGDMPLDPNDPVVLKLEGKIDQALNFLFFGSDGNWPGPPYIRTSIDELLARPAATVDVKALASELAPLLPAGADPKAVAAAVAALLGSKLST